MEVRKPSKLNDRTSDPLIVIEGIEAIIKKDRDKHKEILDRTQLEILAYRNAVSSEVKKKKYYLKLIGQGKFNDESLRTSIDQMNINIRHLQDKVKLSNDKIKHETEIVDTLTEQLDNQYKSLKILAEHREKEKNAISNRLDK